jgi:hypothetical protein
MTAPVLSVPPPHSNTLTRRGHPHMTDATRYGRQAGAVAGCVGNGRGYLRRGDGIASGGEVNYAPGGRLTEALPAIDLAHADLT